MPVSLITLTSDFGYADNFVGVMKGVILSIAPTARIVDLGHDITRGDIRHGAFVLLSGSKYFPLGTLHVAVIDPGVGTERRIICVEAGGQLFLGPDNGLLSWVTAKQGRTRVIHVTRKELFLPQISLTFHGRDVFAPVAAHLARDMKPEDLGPVISDMQELPFPEVRKQDGSLVGEIIYEDRFGNLVSNIEQEALAGVDVKKVVVTAGQTTIRGLSRTYGSGREGQLLALVGSPGYLEIAVNEGLASEVTGLDIGDAVTVSFNLNGQG